MDELEVIIQSLAIDGYVNSVKALIDRSGVKHRPLSKLFLGLDKSWFLGLNLNQISDYRKTIQANFTSKEPELNNVVNQCLIAEIFITHPTEELNAEIKKLQYEHYPPYLLLPFFVWVAQNNRRDLLNTTSFANLFVSLPKLATECIKVAAVFGNTEFITDVIGTLSFESVRTVLSIAVADKNQVMLLKIIAALNTIGITLNAIYPADQDNHMTSYGLVRDDDPLFWAVNCENTTALQCLLENGMDPNHYKDNFTAKTLLHMAMKIKNMEVINLLIEHGAKLKSAQASQLSLGFINNNKQRKENTPSEPILFTQKL